MDKRQAAAMVRTLKAYAGLPINPLVLDLLEGLAKLPDTIDLLAGDSVPVVFQLPTNVFETLEWIRAQVEDLREGPEPERHAALFEGIAAGWLFELLPRCEAEDKHAEMIYLAFQIGRILTGAESRHLALHTKIGQRQKDVGDARQKENAKNCFKITRDELLKLCRDCYRRYRCNQAELRQHVSDAVDNAVGPDRIKQLMSDHGIRAEHYKKV